MRVAFVAFAFDEYSIRLASALAEHVEIALWLTEGQAQHHVSRLSPHVEFRPFVKPRMRHPVSQVRTMRRLIRELRAYRPDVIHIQQGYLWLNPALTLLSECPLVITVHDPRPHHGDWLGWKTPPFITEYGFRRAARLIAHNEQMKDVLAQRGFPPDHIDVVPTVVRGEGESRTDMPEDGNLVLFFGRIWGYKGLEYLIRAEPIITEVMPEVKIIIAGRGEDFRKYRRMMAHPNRFIVHNEYISEQKKTELFQRASVVVLPYVDATQSAVIATAYNFERPVVATTVGGLPAMVDDGETGYLIPPRDERALADAVLRLMKDADLRRRLGVQGRLKAEREYSARSVAQRTLEVYSRAVGDGPVER